VKKLDLTKYEKPESAETRGAAAAKKEVNTFNCEMIKDQLEKRTAQPEQVSPFCPKSFRTILFRAYGQKVDLCKSAVENPDQQSANHI
jgi:hypothetical protein